MNKDLIASLTKLLPRISREQVVRIKAVQRLTDESSTIRRNEVKLNFYICTFILLIY